MHVHLVAPSNEDSTYIKPLWAQTLAAHTPSSMDVTFRDDGLDPIDLTTATDTPDLVGISVSSKTAARAYAIADAYRARGVQVRLQTRALAVGPMSVQLASDESLAAGTVISTIGTQPNALVAALG